MSDPSPRKHEAEAQTTDANGRHQERSLEKQLESIDLNDQQSSARSEELRKKLSARDFLERLNRRRLEVSCINVPSDDTRASKGGYGEVVVATLVRDGDAASEAANQVAVKKFIISDDIDEEKFLRTFANELHVLDRLDHPNIIKLIGFVEDMKGRKAWLVFPWQANGNVREFLLSGKWELPERVSLVQDVASGLEYLHGQKPPIRHGDLKSLNILVNSEHRAVITDFGSARIQTEARGFEAMSGSPRRRAGLAESTVALDGACPELTVSAANAELTLTGPSWSFRWAAPEILNEEEPSLASDIWALGWIAWEVVTDNYPFPEAKTNQLITVKVVKGLLPVLHDDSQLSQIGLLCGVMANCWRTEPKERPSAVACCNALRWIPSAIPRTGDRTSQIRSATLLMQMGSMHVSRRMYRESLKFFEEAVAIAHSTADKGAIAHTLFLSADSHRMMLNYDKAEEACKQSLEIYTGIGSSHGRANAFKGLGDVHQAQSNHSKAEEYYNQALAIFTSTGNNLGQANTLKRLAMTSQARSDHARAEEYFGQALAIFTSIEDSLGRASTLQGLGEIHQTRSSHATAEEYFKQALSIYTSIGNTLSRANALQALGFSHKARSRHIEAGEYFNQALVIYTSIGESLGRANALRGLGETHQAQFDHEKAEEYSKQALSIYTSVGNTLGRASALRMLGLTHQAQSNYAEAEQYFNQALTMYASTGNSIGRANTFQELGEIHHARSDHAKAEEHFKQALSIYSSIENNLGRANALHALGLSHKARSNHIEAGEYFNQALAIHTSIGNSIGRANAFQGLGDIHQAQSDHGKAEECLKQALSIYTSTENTLGRANALQTLGLTSLAQSNYAEAKEYFDQALAMYTNIGSSLGRASAIRGLGEIHQAQSSHATAEECFKQALVLYTETGNGFGRTNALLGMAEVLLRQARYSEAKSILHDAAEVSNQIDYEWAQTRVKELLTVVPEEEKLPNQGS